MIDKGYAIAIDGPVAAGKGTIAPLLAEKLHGFHLYTGATYRSVALACIEKGINLNDSQQVISVMPNVSIEFVGNRYYLNGKDVTERIKDSDVAQGASVVGVIPQVREAMVAVQQKVAQKKIENGEIVVAEGRDTGTKVFPEAGLKVYLTARDEVRAQRRLTQYKNQGEEKELDQVLSEIRERDKRDQERALDPLPSEPEKHGYFIVDDSDISEEETVSLIAEELKKKGILHD